MTCTMRVALAGALAGLVGLAVANAEDKAAAKSAEKPAKVLVVDELAPAWKDLDGVDGKKHALGDLEKAKLVAVVFTCNTCPVAVAYEDRLNEYAKEFKDKGVELVAINVNLDPQNNLEKMKGRAKEKKFAFPYLFDSTQVIARQYGATVTPHVFLLDSERYVAYMGSIDDNMDAKKVKKNFLRDATVALLEGKEVKTSETEQFGCGIGYKKDTEKLVPKKEKKQLRQKKEKGKEAAAAAPGAKGDEEA